MDFGIKHGKHFKHDGLIQGIILPRKQLPPGQK